MRRFLLFCIVLFIGSIFSLNTFKEYPVLQFGSFSLQHQMDLDLVKNTKNSITFVGDVMLARGVEKYLNGYGSTYVYAQLPKLSSTTELIGNFEGAIQENHTPTPDYTFLFSIDSVHIPAMQQYGFSYMSLANNHSFDFGTTSLNVTRTTLTDNTMQWFGDPNNVSSTTIRYLDISDKKIALIGINTIGVNYDVNDFKLLIKESIKQSDIQIIYIHWGTEYDVTHSQEQQNIAYGLVEAGADVIIGSHPHVIQDIEAYKGSLILYSLGNFIFDQYFSHAVQKGLVAKISFSTSDIQISLNGVSSITTPSAPKYISNEENDSLFLSLAKKSSPTIAKEIKNGLIVLSLENLE